MPTEDGTGTIQQRDFWSIVQTIFIVLTPLVLGIGGFIVNQNISALRTTAEKVEKMVPLLDRLADTNLPKSQMAAHAMYLLMKDDPCLAVRVILAANKPELEPLLRDIAIDDPKVKECLSKGIPGREGKAPLETSKTQFEVTAASIIQSTTVTTIGWCYVGKRDDDAWEDVTIELDDSLPQQDKEYSVTKNTYLRKTPPTKPDYTLGDVVGELKKDSRVKVLKVQVFEPGELTTVDDWQLTRVWAKVSTDLRKGVPKKK